MARRARPQVNDTVKELNLESNKIGPEGAASIAEGKYMAMGWVMVADQDAFDAGMAAHGAKIMGDVPNYTNARPEVLMGETTGGSQ